MFLAAREVEVGYPGAKVEPLLPLPAPAGDCQDLDALLATAYDRTALSP